jgi:DNA repair protein RadC
MLLLPMSAMATLPEVDKMTGKYTSKEQASVVNISKQMLRMMGRGIAGVEHVDNIVMLSSDNKSAMKGITKRTKKAAKKHKMENLVTLNESAATTFVYTQISNDKITEALVLVIENNKTTLINISGNIPQEVVDSLVGVISKIG